MGEEFYSIIKLVSGEEIFSLISIEDEEDPAIILQNPVIMKLIHHKTGMHVKIKQWIDLSDEDIFIIKSDKIITMTESNDQKLIRIYNDFIENSDEEDIDIENPDSFHTKPSTKMGYISSVEKARKDLEDIFNREIQENQSPE
jgi:hypothetical protein